MAPPRITQDQAVRLLGAGASVDIGDVARPKRRRSSLATPAASGAAKRPETGQNIRAAPARVLGLDLAQTTGWALLVDGRPAEHGRFTLPDRARREALAHWHGRQARRLAEQVRVLLSTHCPEVVAYEYPDGYRRAWSGGTKGREFVVAAALGRLQGFLVALWPEIGGDVQLVAVSTTDAKRTATGRVDANKAQVRWALMTYRQWDLSRWSDDEVDGASIALAAREAQ